jgi:hypothetical protein
LSWIISAEQISAILSLCRVKMKYDKHLSHWPLLKKHFFVILNKQYDVVQEAQNYVPGGSWVEYQVSTPSITSCIIAFPSSKLAILIIMLALMN